MAKETICWLCENAYGGCSWSDHWKHEPVPGWKAVPVRLKLQHSKQCDTYVVEDCPEFRPIKPRKRSREWADIAKNCQK